MNDFIIQINVHFSLNDADKGAKNTHTFSELQQKLFVTKID